MRKKVGGVVGGCNSWEVRKVYGVGLGKVIRKD